MQNEFRKRISFPACTKCLRASLHISIVWCVYTFTWPLKSLLPQPELPVESQMKPGCVDVMCLACNAVWLFLCRFLFSVPLWELGKVKHRWVCQHCSLHCVQCSQIPLYMILHSNTSPCFLLLSPPGAPLHLLLLLFIAVPYAADKDVDDYYTRKRHLPDLAARGTLPLHVLKIGQDQVGT